ncbi:MAG: pyruvate kinase, partial [Dehalococcoidia bacterium]
MRLAKIVATLGPASAKPETVRAMIRAGMDVARLNAAHGTVAERAAAVRTVREAAEAEGKAMAILLDLAGAKIRTGAGSVTLLEGDVVDLRAGRGRSGGGLIYVDYEDLAGDVRPGERVLLADGEAELEVLEGSAGGLRCRVLAGGRVGTRKGVAFPDSELRLEVPTVADREAVEWGSREGVDYLGLSFTGAASHVAALKQQVRELGGAAATRAQSGPDRAADDYYYARGLDRKGHTDLAIGEYRKFLKVHRGHARTAEVLYLLGTAEHKVGDFERGETTLRRLVSGYDSFAMKAEAC